MGASGRLFAGLSVRVLAVSDHKNCQQKKSGKHLAFRSFWIRRFFTPATIVFVLQIRPVCDI